MRDKILFASGMGLMVLALSAGFMFFMTYTQHVALVVR